MHTAKTWINDPFVVRWQPWQLLIKEIDNNIIGKTSANFTLKVYAFWESDESFTAAFVNDFKFYTGEKMENTQTRESPLKAESCFLLFFKNWNLHSGWWL